MDGTEGMENTRFIIREYSDAMCIEEDLLLQIDHPKAICVIV